MANDDKTKYDGGETIVHSDNITSTATDGAGPALVAANRQANDIIPIEKYAVLLDTYRVDSGAIQGGMGKMWRVRHGKILF